MNASVPSRKCYIHGFFFERREVFAVMLTLKLGGGQKSLVKVNVILLLEIKQIQVD